MMVAMNPHKMLAIRAEGNASDEAHPSEENRRADERGHQ